MTLHKYCSLSSSKPLRHGREKRLGGGEGEESRGKRME